MAEAVWFHVGYPKAASSFVQQEILSRSEEIDRAVHEGCYHYLFCIREPQPKIHLQYPFFNRYDDFDEEARTRELERVRDLVRESNRTVVFSNETMSMGGRADNREYADDPDTITERIHDWFPEAHILVVLRHQPDWVASWYRDLVHSGRNEWRTVTEILESNLWKDHVEDQLRYDEKIASYQKQFGPERVHVVLFEEIRRDPGRFMERVSDAIGIAPPPPQDRVVNRGLSDEIIRIRRKANRFYHTFIRNVVPEEDQRGLDRRWFMLWKNHLNKIQDILRFSSKDTLVPDTLTRSIEERFRDSNRRLDDLLDIDLGTYGYAI